MRWVRSMIACIGAGALAALIGCDQRLTLMEQCDEPIDVSEGGKFAGTTCDSTDSVLLPCNQAGTEETPELIFALLDTTGDATWSFELDEHTTLGIMARDTCGGPSTCDPSMVSMKTGLPGIWYFAVEVKGGGCGSFSVNVTRLP